MARKPIREKVTESTSWVGRWVHLTGAHSQKKDLFLGIEKPPTQPLGIRILSERRIKSGSEAAERQRSGHVVHMTGA